MLDHVSLSVSDPVRSQAFYAKALAPLGYKVISQFDGGFGIGADGGSAVWAAAGPAQKPIAHLAFRAKDRKQVEAFYQCGARCRRPRQRQAGPARELLADLLRGIRAGPGRQQYRGGVPPPE